MRPYSPATLRGRRRARHAARQQARAEIRLALLPAALASDFALQATEFSARLALLRHPHGRQFTIARSTLHEDDILETLSHYWGR